MRISLLFCMMLSTSTIIASIHGAIRVVCSATQLSFVSKSKTTTVTRSQHNIIQPSFLLLNQIKRSRTVSTILKSSSTSITTTAGDATTKENNKYNSDNNNDDDATPVGIYIHIPYCRKRCHYCDFAIVPIGDRAAREKESSSQESSGFLQMDQIYRSAILDELELVKRTSSSLQQKIRLKSIYFGGGTPSLAPISTIQSILHSILYSDDNTPFSSVEEEIEITIEMDPGTFTLSYLQELQKLVINRISLGIQSFDDDILTNIGRTHRYQDIIHSLDLIQQVFGEEVNYSIDLISGLPGLTLDQWKETLRIATTKLVPKPVHLSLYDLQVEEGTVFGRRYNPDDWVDEDDNDDIYVTEMEEKNNDENHESRDEEDTDTDAEKVLEAPSIEITEITAPRSTSTATSPPQQPSLPTPDECAEMYRYASKFLRSERYEHYEISSYSLVGGDSTDWKDISKETRERNRSKHNQIYWGIGSEWYAVGLGSTSSINGYRFSRPRAMYDYVNWVKKQKEMLSGSGNAIPDWLPPSQQEEDDKKDNLDDDEFLADVIMTRLRTAEGLDLDWIVESFGREKLCQVLRGAQLGLDLELAERIPKEEQKGVATDHEGYLRLVDPDGFLFSNTLISSIFAELGDTG